MEQVGMVLVVVATLVLGAAATRGPVKSVARAWLTVEALTIGAATMMNSDLASLAAAVALVLGVPVAGLVVMVWSQGREHTKAR